MGKVAQYSGADALAQRNRQFLQDKLANAGLRLPDRAAAQGYMRQGVDSTVYDRWGM